MRRIALLTAVAVLAACGGSSTPGNGYVRFANLSPDLVAAGSGIDFCVVPTGASFTGAVGVMSRIGATASAGLVFGGDGSKSVSIYLAKAEGTYDVNAIAVGSSCTTPLATATGVTLSAGQYRTVAAIGLTTITGAASAGAKSVRAYTDTVTVTATKVAARFVNVGFLPAGGGVIPFPTFNLLQQVGSTYPPILSNVAYPGPGTGTLVDANGYVTATPAELATGPLWVCAAGAEPPSAACSQFTIPGDIAQAAGVVASAFVINVVPASPAGLFCVDNLPNQAGQVYAVCTAPAAL